MVALDMLQSGGSGGGVHDFDSFIRLHDKLEQSMAFIIDSKKQNSFCNRHLRVLYWLQRCRQHIWWNW